MTINQPQQLGRPDLDGRPHHFSVEREMKATPKEIFRAWTEEFDSWFAAPGAVRMVPKIDAPYYFEVVHQGKRSPHYGRFLTLDPPRVVELTWSTGKNGTDGAETVVSVELTPAGSGTRLRLTHAGFYDATAAKRHEDSWPPILGHLDQRLLERRAGQAAGSTEPVPEA